MEQRRKPNKFEGKRGTQLKERIETPTSTHQRKNNLQLGIKRKNNAFPGKWEFGIPKASKAQFPPGPQIPSAQRKNVIRS